MKPYDPWRDYDRWKLMSPEDEADEAEASREREEALEDEGERRWEQQNDR